MENRVEIRLMVSPELRDWIEDNRLAEQDLTGRRTHFSETGGTLYEVAKLKLTQ